MGSQRWLTAVGLIACSMIVGVAAYSIGLSQGAAQVAADAGTLSGDGWRWHGHWAGFPFGFFIMFWVVMAMLRGIFWGGPWHYRRRWRHDWYDDDPRRFEEWHRREHERMDRPTKV